ncbi:hypothetical protein Tco_0679091 [Tanacetum coccineum]|uniref:Uncharacterized protein n=1 Tax=Tanacetum coccineum TaxID=301880 RepID=A0ABQ4XIC9_9ASTR
MNKTSSYSLLASQSSCPQLDHEDLDQVDEYDLEEMDLKWQVAMISMRIKKFYKKTGRKLQFDAKEPVGFDKTNQSGMLQLPQNRAILTGKKEESKAMVTVDGECVDWITHSEDDENFAFMASNSSGSDTIRSIQVCLNECKESYANLKRLYDAQREQLSDASVEIKAYTQGLKKVEAQLVAHQQGQLWCNKGDFENPPLHKRLVKTCEMQAVPPPMTGNYLPSGPDIEIDDSQYTYGPRKSQPVNLNLNNELDLL